MKIIERIDHLKREWNVPKVAFHQGVPCPFKLICNFQEPSLESLQAEWYPEDLSDFWEAASSAELYKDNEFGQWGLRLFSLEEAQRRTSLFERERSRDVMPGDLIIGEFLGDSDLLLCRTDTDKDDFGAVMVALPLDPRDDWDLVGESFGRFLDKYVEGDGGKFWEHR